MKEVDDALLTALAENCRQLTHVSIKGCGLVGILNYLAQEHKTNLIIGHLALVLLLR